MASTTPVVFTFTLRDEMGTRAVVDLYALIDSSAAMDDQLGNLNGLAVALDALTGAQVIRAEIRSPDLRGGYKGAPIAGARVETGALWDLSNEISRSSYGVFVPALLNSLIVGGTVDRTATPVINFEALFTGGISDGFMTTPNRQATKAVEDVRLALRRRRKSLSRTSFELP